MTSKRSLFLAFLLISFFLEAISFHHDGIARAQTGRPVDPRVQGLIGALKHEDWNMRGRAAWALGLTNNDAAVEPLMGIALRDENNNVREQAINALGMLKNPKAVDTLTVVLDDPDLLLRRSAIGALKKIKDARASKPLASVVLKDPDESIRREAIEALKAISDDAALTELLLTGLENADLSIQRNAVQALASIEDPSLAAPLIAFASGSEDETIRLYSISALASIDDVDVTNYLLFLLRDKSPEVRRSAAQSLGGRNGEGVVRSLVAALGDEDWGVRSEAVVSLGKHRSDEAGLEAVITRAIAGALKDEDATVRRSAVASLEEIKSPDSVQALIDASLEDSDESVRRLARQTVLALAPQRIQDSAVSSLQSDRIAVRRNAVNVLSEMPTTANIEALVKSSLLDEDEDIRELAAFAVLASNNPGHLNLFIDGLQSGSLPVRKNAIAALRKTTDARVIPPLIKALTDNHPSVRSLATQALSNFRDPQVVKPLIDALLDNDPTVRAGASSSLATITDQDFGEDEKAWLRWWEATHEAGS